MIGPRLLSAVAVLMALLLGFVSYRRLGRTAGPLTLLALMAATGRLLKFECWVSTALNLVDHLRGRPFRLWSGLAGHPLYPLWKWYAPSILAIAVILWLILAIRRRAS